MNSRWVLLLLLTLAYVDVAAKDVTSRIDAVTVYPDGATVTRVANVELRSGSNAIRLIGLVSDLDAEQIQLDVADTDVQVGQIRLDTEQHSAAFNQRIEELQLEIDALSGDVLAIEDSSAAAKRRLTFLESIATGYGKEAGGAAKTGSADVTSWRNALDLIQTGSEDASRLIRSNDEKSKQLSRKLSQLNRQMATLNGGALASTIISLTVESPRAMTTSLRLSYFQEDASWHPLYEARLNSDTARLQLKQQANIEQETDESWNNVNITLSTNTPLGDLSAPLLDSEFLNLTKPMPANTRLEMMKMQRSAGAAMDNSSLEEVVVTGSRVSVDVGNFAVNYVVPGRTTIENDSDDAVTVDLARYAFDTQLVTQVVPRESTQAFLAARFQYDQAEPLYGSSMTVFVDGSFVGNSDMPTALPQTEVLLPMGPDRRIEVKAQDLGGGDADKGIIRKRKTETTDFLFEINNRRQASTDIEILDRIPVARNKAIEVTVPDTASPVDNKDIDDEPGLVRWVKTLEANETWRVRHQYVVTYPADYILYRE